jgi:hypothetical protein
VEEKDMHMKKFLISMLLVTVIALPSGIDQAIFAQTLNSDGSSGQTSAGIKNTTPAKNNSRFSKRNQMMIEQAESARLRAEKIKAGSQGNTERPTK